MTEPLTVKDLNCGNCIVPHKVVNALSRHPKFYCNDVELPIATYQVVCERGCCTNPLALQVLAQGVVKELEQKATHYHNESEGYAESLNKPLEERLWGEWLGITEAIKLLQGDTK